jgi:hypothetical protein
LPIWHPACNIERVHTIPSWGGQDATSGRAARPFSPTIARRIAPVASSTGKKDLIAISKSVTSNGVPNNVVVKKNDSGPAAVSTSNGRTNPPASSSVCGAGLSLLPIGLLMVFVATPASPPRCASG